MTWFRPWTRWLALFLFLGGMTCLLLTLRQPSDLQLLEDARLATALGERERALNLYEQVLASDPASTAALLEGSEVSLELGRASQAETYLRRILQLAPEDHTANVRLAYLLGVEGRCWEAAPFLLASVKQGEFTLHHLVLLAASEPVIADSAFVEKCLRAVPDDPLPLLGIARTRFQQNDAVQAEALLRQVLSGSPASVEAHAMLGRVLAATDVSSLPKWQLAQPPEAESHPEVWWARGAWAEQQADLRGAVRCYAEAVRLDPNHRTANYRLGQVLMALDQHKPAQPFVERADKLRDLALLVDQVFSQPDSLAHLQRAAELTRSLGRPWEAWGWYQIVLRQAPSTEWATKASDELRAELRPDSPRNVEAFNPALRLNLDPYELPAFVRDASRSNKLNDVPGSTTSNLPPSNVQFADVAREVGLDFTYFNRPGIKTGDIRMLDTTGGGIAVLDYDCNGYPDLYFTQGCEWPPSSSQGSLEDQFFRNTGEGRFENVGAAAGIGDPGYGQGVTTGDFDNDGFPDLYVANIGANRLYHNNGDGTFSDVTNAAGISGELWTTSCLMADLNGDSLPDLYDVNYLAGAAALTQICRHGDEVRWCSPDAFEAEPDQVYLNLGDGRFENVTHT